MIPDLRASLQQLEPFLDECCESWRRCTRDEHSELLRNWRQLYPGDVLPFARGRRGARAFAEQENLHVNHFYVVQTRDPAVPPRTVPKCLLRIEVEKCVK